MPSHRAARPRKRLPLPRRSPARVRGRLPRRAQAVAAVAVTALALGVVVTLTGSANDVSDDSVAPAASGRVVEVADRIAPRTPSPQVEVPTEYARRPALVHEGSRGEIAHRRAARRLQLRLARERRERRIARMQKDSSFRVGTLNILGSQHTAGPGGYGPGPERAGISAGLVVDRGVDVMGMQEVQDDQLPVLLSRLSSYTIWPQHALGSNGQRLQIAWRSSRFEMVESGSITYPFDRQRIPLPYVLLRDRETLAEFWVITTHNSARDLEAERDAATQLQIGLIRDLGARADKPVLIMGDVNEHTEFFQTVCGATGFLAANGGGSGCSLPPNPLRVDWIMGGGGAGVDFSGYVQDGASLARASDHYFIHANVTVTDPGEK